MCSHLKSVFKYRLLALVLQDSDSESWGGAQECAFLKILAREVYFFHSLFVFLGFFRQSGWEGEEEGERERVTLTGWLSLGIEPAIKVCALDWESNRRPPGPRANVLTIELTSQGKGCAF